MPALSCSSSSAADRAAGSAFGRRPAARSRSTVRFRAIVCSQAASDPIAGSNELARFHNARNVSWTTSSATCRSEVSRLADGVDRVDVPVVELRQGVLRPGRDRADEGGVVGRLTVLGHGYAGSARRFRRDVSSGRRSKPLERTTSVSVLKTLGVDWTWRRTRSRSRVSRARTLMQVVGLAGDVVALLDLGDRRERLGQVHARRPGRLGDPAEREDVEADGRAGRRRAA